jgi:hypothetical protein
MRVPSGDHAGPKTCTLRSPAPKRSVTGRSPLPSALMTQRSRAEPSGNGSCPLCSRTNASFDPSGDQLGEDDEPPPGERVIRVTAPLSTSTV